MSSPIRTRRKNRFNVLKEASKLNSFDEFPLLRPEVDPQMHVSRNSVDQPFYLICQKDSVLAQITGESRVVFDDGPARYFDMGPGDYVYVPEGYVHRVLTVETGVQLRYKARLPGTETVLFKCTSCDEELDRYTWDASSEAAQAGYHAATTRFNSEPQRRHCAKCGHDNLELDLSPFRWAAVAEKLAEVDEEEEQDEAPHAH